ncbi:S24 family peptidase [Dongia soli]|uniref:S24 family peptidase n=1 Tax=Dongia soli TaxID=600628 RepID=A0ABU5E7L4_9PROT|nr:S24 family peptidase [Dongia soli]MDY0882283.1 S24 family peptidase [Dongia soli]
MHDANNSLNFANSSSHSLNFAIAEFREEPEYRDQHIDFADFSGDEMPKGNPDQLIAERRRLALRKFMQARKLTINGWAEKAGVSESGIRSFLKGKSQSLGTRVLERLAKAEHTTVAVLLGDGEPAEVQPPESRLRHRAGSRGQDIREVEVRAGMGPGQLPEQVEHPKDVWTAPQGFFGRSSDLLILEVDGDSMLPVLEPADRVVVNTADRIPSPAGIFAVFDGHGIMVKHVSTVAQSNPMRIHIRSSNPIYPPEEWLVEEDTIIGRVKGLIRRF